MRMAVLIALMATSEGMAAEVATYNGELYVQRQPGGTVFRLPLMPGIYQFTQPTAFSPLSIAGNDDGACALNANHLNCVRGSVRFVRPYISVDVIGRGVALQEQGGYYYVAQGGWSTYVGRFEVIDTAEQLFAPAFGCGVTMPGDVTCFDEFGSPVPSPAMTNISEVDVGTSPNIDAIAYRRNTSEVEVHNLVTGHWWQDVFSGLQAVDISTDDGIVCASGLDASGDGDVWCYSLEYDQMLAIPWPAGTNPPQIWVVNDLLVTLEGVVVEIFRL